MTREFESRARGREHAARSSDAALRCPAVRYAQGAPSSTEDALALEEPLEIRIAGDPFTVTMRTPGYDEELAAGFLFAEGLIASARDLGRIAHCGRPSDEGYGNVVDVAAAPGAVLDVEALEERRRRTITASACGVCGRRTIEDLVVRCGTVTDDTRFAASVVSSLPAALRAAQPGFTATGGLHAAAIAGTDGRLVVVREDVGRHNAVDKVVGRLLLDGALPARGRALVVSGRSSFEIVQKAIVAGIPLVASVSAVSSLAASTAERAGVTLVGFARGSAFTAYTHPERIVP
jgi:FdhD protein